MSAVDGTAEAYADAVVRLGTLALVLFAVVLLAVGLVLAYRRWFA